jgi:GrpB-like predicted nucleotidyltransferase (UPF0157 family)
MSLCVVWKADGPEGTSVCFAADSCISVLFKDEKTGDYKHLRMPYGGIKVLQIPVHVIPVGRNTPGPVEEPFEAVYGMAFAGDFVAAFLVKESVAEVLQHGQFAGPMESFSFSAICRLVLRLYDHFYRTLRSELSIYEETAFFLGGFCPLVRKVRVAKFCLDPDSGAPRYHEVLEESNARYDLVGQDAAAERFRALFDLNLTTPQCRVHFVALRRLREIIRDPTFPAVDGAIQYGAFNPSGNFELAGSFDLQFQDGRLTPKTYIRGTDLDELLESQGPGDLFVHYPLIHPFEEDGLAFDPSHLWSEDGSGVALDELTTIVPYDPAWTGSYLEAHDLLKAILGQRVLAIEHIGSTAISGMAARPVIDVMIGVSAFGDPRSAPFDLKALGYDYLQEYGLPGRLLYRKRNGGYVDIHVVAHGGELWDRALQIRGFLQSRSDEAQAFAREKLGILNTGAWTLLRYLRERSPYMLQLSAKALRSKGER